MIGLNITIRQTFELDINQIPSKASENTTTWYLRLPHETQCLVPSAVQASPNSREKHRSHDHVKICIHRPINLNFSQIYIWVKKTQNRDIGWSWMEGFRWHGNPLQVCLSWAFRSLWSEKIAPLHLAREETESCWATASINPS